MIAVHLGARRLRALERGALITPEEQAELVRLARLGQQLVAGQTQGEVAERSIVSHGMACIADATSPRH